MKLWETIAYVWQGDLYTESAIEHFAEEKGLSFERFCARNEVSPYTVQDAMDADYDVTAWDYDHELQRLDPVTVWEVEEEETEEV
jgi:hypothetical protein